MDFRQQTDDAVKLLSALIATPSVSRDEAKAADIMERAMLDARAGEVKRIGNNVWIIDPEYDAARQTVLLSAHLDTVKASDSWSLPPFEATLRDGRLYGLGSNDCGGGLVSLFQAYRICVGRPRNYNLVYMASAEEEVSGAGGLSLALPHLPHIDVAVVGEPTGMQPAIAERGLMVIDAVAHGKAGHAARNEGINAIYEALDDVEWLRNHEFERVSTLLGPVKTSVTVIGGGTQHNVVPDACSFVIDVRTNELYTNEEVFSLLQQGMKSTLKARSFRLSSSHIDCNHPLIRRCTAMGMTPFGSPTLSDQALMPFPSFKLGPGDSARSHSADEYIEIGEIADSIEKYVRLLS